MVHKLVADAIAQLAGKKAFNLVSETPVTLEYADVAAITSALQANRQIEKIIIKNCIFAAGIDSLASKIKGCKSLKKLSITHANLNSVAAVIIAGAIKDLSSLRQLDLAHNSITDMAASFLCLGLANKPYLHSLNLAHHLLAPAGIIALAARLAEQPLTFLDLSTNIFDHDSAEALGRALVGKNKLQVLRLANCAMYTGETAIIAHAIAGLPALSEINLAENMISCSQQVMAAIASCRALKLLILDHTYISDDGARVLARAICGHPNLQRIQLSRNSIRETGLADLVKALGVNYMSVIAPGFLFLTSELQAIALTSELQAITSPEYAPPPPVAKPASCCEITSYVLVTIAAAALAYNLN